jgi:hypothetical protein
MKKSKILLSLLAITSIAFISCEKNYCASCVEAKTKVTGNYCGKESEVDDFISELKRLGSSNNQNWSCTKTAD